MPVVVSLAMLRLVREILVRQTHDVGEKAHGCEVDCCHDGRVDRRHDGIGP